MIVNYDGFSYQSLFVSVRRRLYLDFSEKPSIIYKSEENIGL